jgi:hypothetical protein
LRAGISKNFVAMEFDTIVKNGTVVTASDIWNNCDIGIKVCFSFLNAAKFNCWGGF